MLRSPARIVLAVSLAAAAFAPRPALAGQGTVPDGFGGCFVAWDERRYSDDVVSTSEVLVQHFTSTGAVAPGWPAYGLHVTDSPPNQDSPAIVSDGAGGVIVVWMDYTGGGQMPRAQHLSAIGQHLWSSAGVALSEGDSLRSAPVAVPDGAGGAFVAWNDRPALAPIVNGIVVQHLESTGLIVSGWPEAGLLIKQDYTIQSGPTVFGDGAGGAIVVWLEGTWFAQRLTSSGVRLWSPPAGMDLGLSYSARVAGDGAGGLLFALDGLGLTFDYEVVAHRFDGSGTAAWGATGIVVRSSPTAIGGATVVPDSLGGAIVAWQDYSAGGSFAQRLDATGAVVSGWPADGAQISDAGGPGVVAADGTGGAFFAWAQFAGPPPFEVRSQHLANDGTLASGWPSSGAVAAAGTRPGEIALIGDGTGGDIVSWRDALSGLLGVDLVAQRLDATSATQWGGGLSVSSETGAQRAPAIVSDGAGGAVAFWADKRSGGWDIYGRHVSSIGLPLHASAVVSAAPDDQVRVQAVGDGAGGGIAAWRDWRGGTQAIEAQRLSSTGVPAWTPDGVALYQGLGSQVPIGLASDGAGGAIVAWPQVPNTVYAQRLDAGGSPLWGTDGVSLVADANSTYQSWMDAIPDGAGGAIIVWWGYGFDPDSVQYVYGYHAQRVDGDGGRLWGNDGVVIARSLAFGTRQRVTGDGAGGVYLAWQEDGLPYGVGAIRVQHRDAAGHLATGWPEHGVAVASLPNRKQLSAIAPDGAGGVVVGWCELRGGPPWTAYAERLSADATSKWSTQGIQLTTNAGDQMLAGLVPDGSGGAIAVWMDGSGTTWDIRAQHVNDVGVRQWQPAGVGVCTAAGHQYAPAIVSDGAGGALVAWQDDRAFPKDEIYMARVDASGALLWPSDGVVPVLASLVSATARGGVAHLEWRVAASAHVEIERSDDGAAWSKRTALEADGEGRVRFEDADVLPARRYGWRLAIAVAGGVERAGEAWLEIPGGASFALWGARPNPSGADPALWFSLRSGAPATLEILDVAGRRVWSREVGALGAGTHVVSPPELRAGLYMVRLTQGASRATSRFTRLP